MKRYILYGSVFLLAASVIFAIFSQGGASGKYLTIYCGRSEALVGPLIERFKENSGLAVRVRWGSTAELAATLLEEGGRARADVFFAQDPGGLGAVADMLAILPDEILVRVDPRFRDGNGRWVGISGRSRVVVYNTDQLSEDNLPSDLWGYTQPEWRERLGWAPTNASFQTMVTAMRALWGEEDTSRWLHGIQANAPKVYPNNTSIVAAVGAGEIDAGFVNHYYLYRFLQEEGESFPARNLFLGDGGPGSLVMAAGAGALAVSQNHEAAHEFIAFLLSEEAQRYFADRTHEYSLAGEGIAPVGLPRLNELQSADIGAEQLQDMQGAIRLLQREGILP